MLQRTWWAMGRGFYFLDCILWQHLRLLRSRGMPKRFRHGKGKAQSNGSKRTGGRRRALQRRTVGIRVCADLNRNWVPQGKEQKLFVLAASLSIKTEQFHPSLSFAPNLSTPKSHLPNNGLVFFFWFLFLFSGRIGSVRNRNFDLGKLDWSPKWN